MNGIEHGIFSIQYQRPLGPLRANIKELIAGKENDELRKEIWEPSNRELLAYPSFRKCVEADTYPIPAPPDRESYFEGKDLEYWMSGLRDALSVIDCMEALSIPSGLNHRRILDLGGTSGRVLRHFIYLTPENELFCADITDIGIIWIQENMGDKIKAFQNLTFPHLPFEDNSLDAVTAFSVFTHIDHFEDFWLMELRRILKLGGIAYLTFHSERMWKKMKKDHFLYDYLVSVPDAGGNATASEELFSADMPLNRVRFRLGNGKANTSVVFHSDEAINKYWGSIFKLREIRREGHLFQDVAVLQKA